MTALLTGIANLKASKETDVSAFSIPIERALAATKPRGTTRDGRPFIETPDVRRAAESLGGYIRETQRGYAKVMRALGGEPIANGHEGSRWAFDASKLKEINRQYSTEH